MDAETEKRLAKLIMEEAAILRRRADEEGVHVYLAKPTVRVRPNPQFLQATIRSVEQSNRMVEVNEMWRRRSAELDLDRRRRRHRGDRSPRRSSRATRSGDSIDEQSREVCSGADLRDDEVEEFLNRRIKRGRGSVGSRMDDTGPYPAAEKTTTAVDESCEVLRTKEEWEERLVGPRLPEKVAEAWKRAKEEEEISSSKKDRKRKKSKEEKKTKKHKEHKTKKRKKSSSD